MNNTSSSKRTIADIEAEIEKLTQAEYKKRYGYEMSRLEDHLSAVTDDASCQKCRRPFAAGEAVYRARLASPSLFGWAIRLESFCRGCTPKNRYYQHKACVACGREVWNQSDSTRRKRFTCSRRCQVQSQVAVHAPARAAQRAERLRKICATCGRSFNGTRSDAATCSPACRQKAYRQRNLQNRQPADG